MACLRRYPAVFNRETINKELILHFYGQITTRTFGSSLNEPLMIPMADNYNHANVQVCPYIVNQNLHGKFHDQTLSPGTSKYFTPSKFMNDYSKVFGGMETSGPVFFDWEKYESNQQSELLNTAKVMAKLN